MEYKDYYKILGVERTAAQKEIQAAYRKLARTMHPDVNKAPDAEAKFKAVNEAYEVLKDPEKRKKYDTLGPNWRDGDNYQPPPGWENIRMDFGNAEGFDFGGGQFSDFFESLFGSARSRTSRGHRGAGRQEWAMKGQDQEAELSLTLEEAYHGGKKTLRMERYEMNADGSYSPASKEYTVNIPAGVTEESRIRLAGQGSPGYGGGPAGDLYLVVRLLPHSSFTVSGSDLTTEVAIAPWEAALGAKVEVPTMTGTVRMTVPPGVQSGQKLRLKGKGMPIKPHGQGDLYVVLKIAVPNKLTPREKELFEELARVSAFNPRRSEG